jgi:hypothetical protein
MICGNCEQWQSPEADPAASTLRCPRCGFVERRWFPPLFILTGPAGSGKSAVLPLLRHALPGWEVFDTDLLWDSGGDWQMVRRNWLRIAYTIAESGRPALLCGIHTPIDTCPERRYFGRAHYLALVCPAEVLAERLRARPAWRGATPEFIQEQHSFCRWLGEHALSGFDPPLAVVDTSAAEIPQTAAQVVAWAEERRTADWHPSERTPAVPGEPGSFHF